MSDVWKHAMLSTLLKCSLKKSLMQKNILRRIEISKTTTAKAMFPDADGIAEINGKPSRRRAKQIQISQFPLNVADARTVHKLQGKSLENLLVSNWSYTTNWVYVVLSRVRTSNGLFLRIPLDHNKLNTKDNIEYSLLFVIRKLKHCPC